MTEFEDNAVVTVEDLNNIAVDLGDTTFSAFSDAKFGVDKLNEITGDIVGKGILNIDKKCEVLTAGSSTYTYVLPGVIVFESGAKIRITSSITLETMDGDYIYAFNDVTTGKASIQTSAEYPTSGDYVMLAQRNAGAAVTDLRQYSVAKTTLSADVENNIVEQEVIVPVHDTSAPYEFTVVPSLPSCQIIVLSSVNDEYRPADYRYYGLLLTESYNTIFAAKISNGTYDISVKKVEGKLIFKASSYVSMNKLKFILA